LDIGDKYSYLCLIDTQSGEVIEDEDPHRFEKSRSVGAYLGLVPARGRSGERDPQKRISKEGDEMLSVSFW
jgi:transposase